ncbi:MAG: Ldh family oxidoreductase [Hyphomicrobiales bacterium]|nr:MAG: Ldh family oxidoreductase [Hyphomicrobiales bacterium]
MLRMAVEDMRRFCIAVLTHYGASERSADIVADQLVDASLRGLEAHGIFRIAEYARHMESGAVKGDAEPTVSVRAPGVFQVDGRHGLGQVAMMAAVDAMTDALQTQSMAAATVSRVGHTGRIGYYTEKLAAGCCIASIFGGGGHEKHHSVAPFGGRRGVMGTNPVAFAIPGLGDIPVSVDFATATTAGGKLRYARDNHHQLPEGQIIDRHGNASRSPEDYFNGGSILPVAGAKGTGLGIIGELIGYALLGEAGEFNWFLQAVRLDNFGDVEEFRRKSELFLKKVNATEPASDFDRVTYPGQREGEEIARTLSTGVAVSKSVHNALVQLAKDTSIPLPMIADVGF